MGLRALFGSIKKIGREREAKSRIPGKKRVSKVLRLLCQERQKRKRAVLIIKKQGMAMPSSIGLQRTWKGFNPSSK